MALPSIILSLHELHSKLLLELPALQRKQYKRKAKAKETIDIFHHTNAVKFLLSFDLPIFIYFSYYVFSIPHCFQIFIK